MGGIGGVAVFHCGLAAAVLFLPIKMLFTRVPVLRTIDLERETVRHDSVRGDSCMSMRSFVFDAWSVLFCLPHEEVFSQHARVRTQCHRAKPSLFHVYSTPVAVLCL